MKDIQKKLRKLGFYKGAIDGIFGQQSQRALADWRSSFQADFVGSDERHLMDTVIRNDMHWPGSRAEFDEKYGKFEYTSNPSGLITPDRTWTHRNLVTTTLPYFGRTTVNHKVLKSLRAIGIICERALGDGYALRLVGAYNPRHKRFDPRRSLSSHAYGAAIDINWDTNQYGVAGDMPPEIVEAFELYGWIWGGRWAGLSWDATIEKWVTTRSLRHSDPMHFQAGKDWD